jgi:hypothetical protein
MSRSRAFSGQHLRSRLLVRSCILLAAVVGLLAGCSTTSSALPPKTSPTATATGSIPTTSPFPQDLFVLTNARIRMIRNLVAFLDAYNGGRLSEALALLTDDVGWTDCDYQKQAVVNVRGKGNMIPYLKARFADHDLLAVATVSNLNSDPATNQAVAVDFSNRRSDTLKRLGFGPGIQIPLSVKFVFANGGRIAGAAFAAGAGDCRP